MFRKKRKVLQYDTEHQKPVIRCSICTGEQVAGFKNKTNGALYELMLIRSEEDLTAFKKAFGLDHVDKEY